MEQIVAFSPIEDWQVESLVITECYNKNLNKFTFFQNGLKIKFTQTEAYAINAMFGAISQDYNTFIRSQIEPKLIPCKNLENLKLLHQTI